MKKIFVLFLFLNAVVCDRFDASFAGSLNREPSSRVVKTARMRREIFENLFNVYDPSFLSLVWPKIVNGVHLFVEHPCWLDVTVFFKDLADGRAWAYNAVDASGRYQSGVFGGNKFWLGSKYQCLQLDNKFTPSGRNDSLLEMQNSEYLDAVLHREKYYNDDGQEWHSLTQRDELMQRLVTADNCPPLRLAYTAVSLAVNITKLTIAKSYDITLGVCLPRSCSPEDVEAIIKFSVMLNDNLRTNRTIPRSVRVTDTRQIQGKYDLGSDLATILLICATTLIFVIAITATIIDLDLIKMPKTSKSMSFDLQKYNNTDEKHSCERKDVIGMNTLTLNNVPIDSNNTNFVTMKKLVKGSSLPPSITLDVMPMERLGSCHRCGRYKRQCLNPRVEEDLKPCPRVKTNSFASFTEQKKHKVGRSLITSFSMNYNLARIFNKNMANKDLSMVHALRIFATFWIIFVHVATLVNYSSEDGGDINERNSAYFILSTGTLAFDTLFFVSGLLSSHHYFFLKSQYTVEELVSFGGACGQLTQFVCFVTNRIIRLLPSYMYSVCVWSSVGRVCRVTSPLARDVTACDTHWWRNLLYITTLYPKREKCMEISWLMSTETQLHVCGALVCSLLSGARSRLAILAAVAAMLGAAAADVSYAHAQLQQLIPDVYSGYDLIIDRPLARVAPYFVGVFTGWLVVKLDGKLHVSKTMSTCLWVSSVVIACACVACAACAACAAWLRAWTHVAWPLAAAWPALLCATNYAESTRRFLDSPFAAALSRMTYSLLLLHGVVAMSVVSLVQVPLSSHVIAIWCYFSGISVLTIIAAFLLSLLVEMPFCSLLRRLSDCAAS